MFVCHECVNIFTFLFVYLFFRIGLVLLLLAEARGRGNISVACVSIYMQRSQLLRLLPISREFVWLCGYLILLWADTYAKGRVSVRATASIKRLGSRKLKQFLKGKKYKIR